MFETIVAALLPIVVTLFLGFFAGWHHDFTAGQASILNRMVMSYALPMTLFAGIMTTSFRSLADHLSVLAWIAAGMIGGYGVVILLSRFVFHSDWGLAALRALAISGPAVPFVGIPILDDLYPQVATLAVTVSSLVMNLIQVPITLVMLGLGTREPATVPAGAPAPASTAQDSSGSSASTQTVGSILLSTFKKSVVWMPLLAFILILFGRDLPTKWEGSFTLLGSATGGVALFAVGATLYAQKITLSKPVTVNVIAKNLVLPSLVLLLMLATGSGTSANDIGLSIVTLSMPTASICVIFAVQYKKAEREMAGTLFFSTMLSIVTMALFIWISHAL